MKKALPLVLSIIMLTACAPAPPPTPPEATPTPLLEVQMQWETPDEGFSTIPAGEDPKYYYEKPLDSFIPSEEYGRIYPYLGSGEMTEWRAVYQYGLCTESGEIITAPIYSAPHLLGSGEQCAYVLYMENEEKREPYGWREGAVGGILVALDGSWVEHFDDLAYGGAPTNGPILVIEREGFWGGLSAADGSVVVPFNYTRSDAAYEAAYGTYFLQESPEGYTHSLTYNRYISRKYEADRWSATLVDENGRTLAEFSGNVYDIGNDFFLIRDSEWEQGNDFKMLWEALETYDNDGNFLGLLGLEVPPETGEERMFEHRANGNYVMLLAENELIVYDRYFCEISRFEPEGAWRYYGYFLADHANQSVQLHSEAIYISDANTGLHRTYRPDGTLLTTCYFGGE